MASFFQKIRDVIFDPEPLEDDFGMDGVGGVEDEDRIETTADSAADDVDTKTRGRKVVNIDKPNLTAVQGSGSMKMILYQPLSYEDSQAIVDNLRARKPVIVNMVDLERECAQRVLDFMAGAVYALSGTIRRVSYGIFVIVPSNVSIVGNGDNEDDEKELFRH